MSYTLLYYMTYIYMVFIMLSDILLNQRNFGVCENGTYPGTSKRYALGKHTILYLIDVNNHLNTNTECLLLELTRCT